MIENFTEEQLLTFQEAFSIFDDNKNGQINLNQLRFVFNHLGIDLNEAEVLDIISDMNLIANEEIDFPTFLTIMEMKMRSSEETNQDEMADLKEAFDIFDSKHDGYIDGSELKKVLGKMGKKMSPEEIDEMIQAADFDGDGKINFDDFVKMLKE